MDELDYCEGCEATGVWLNNAGYCAECIRVAIRDGHAELIRLRASDE